MNQLLLHGFQSSPLRVSVSSSIETSLPQQQATFVRISQARIIACVRAQSADVALDAARAALDGGLSVAIEKLVEEYPSAVIGAGTVLSRRDATSAKDAGAKFLMSPISMQELVRGHRSGPTLFIPGAITPNEVFSAFDWGACVVKLYPVTLMGGLKHVEAIRKAMPFIPLVVSQGISLESLEQYLTVGATAGVLSDAIFPNSLLQAKDFKKIGERAKLAAERSGGFA